MSNIKEASHLVAEAIMRINSTQPAVKFVKEQMLDILLSADNIATLEEEYREEYPYADIQNSYLADVLKQYDQNDQEV